MRLCSVITNDLLHFDEEGESDWASTTGCVGKSGRKQRRQLKYTSMLISGEMRAVGFFLARLARVVSAKPFSGWCRLVECGRDYHNISDSVLSLNQRTSYCVAIHSFWGCHNESNVCMAIILQFLLLIKEAAFARGPWFLLNRGARRDNFH
jgi:hypothetical protein